MLPSLWPSLNLSPSRHLQSTPSCPHGAAHMRGAGLRAAWIPGWISAHRLLVPSLVGAIPLHPGSLLIPGTPGLGPLPHHTAAKLLGSGEGPAPESPSYTGRKHLLRCLGPQAPAWRCILIPGARKGLPDVGAWPRSAGNLPAPQNPRDRSSILVSL